MPDRVTFEWTPGTQRSLRRLFSAMGDPTPALEEFGEYKRRKLVLLFRPKPKGQAAAAGEPPASHTRSLAQSITYNASRSGIEVGTTAKRGALLHHGGEVRAKDRLLTVPVHRDAVGKRARDFSNLDLVPRAGKPPLLVRGRKKRMDVMFVLLRKVTIKPHPWLFWTGEDEAKLGSIIKRRFEEA